MHVRNRARDLALITTFTGIMAGLGVLPAMYPAGIPVPITAQSMGAMLAGAILGSRRGFAAIALFVALVAIGLPLLSGGRGGLGVFAGPSVGYIIGYPIVAFVVGWLVERFGPEYRLIPGIFANFVGGILILYPIGILGTAWRADIPIGAAITGAGWYVVGDCAKVVIAAVVARGVHAANPGLLGRGEHRTRRPKAETTSHRETTGT